MSLNLDAILELLKQHVSPAARRVPPGWEIIAREAHRQGVIDGRAIQMESTSQYDAAGVSERADADTAGAVSAEQERRFEAWAVSEGLIRESHGVLSVNAVCDVAKKAWLAALSAPASQERADAGKDAALTPKHMDLIGMAIFSGKTKEAYRLLDDARAILAANKEPK
jgi:hypothetical protein